MSRVNLPLKILWKSALIAVAIGLSAAPASAAVRAVTSSISGIIYDINLDTGVLTNARNSGLRDLAGIAYSPNGVLYGLTTTGTSTPTRNALYRINLATGASTLVGPTGLTDIFEGDLCFSPSGVLYGLANGQGSGPNKPQLFTINTTTGQATVVGPIKPDGFNLRDTSAGAFGPDGKFYILDDYNDELLQVNPATALIDSSRSFVHLFGLDGMVFDPANNNQLCIVSGIGSAFGGSRYYRYDMQTQVITGIRDHNQISLAGLTIIPEPQATILCAAAITAAARRTRQRRLESSQPRR